MAKRIRNVFLAAAAVISGLCNALIGAGGGILLSLTLGGLFSDEFPDRRDVYVNSQAAMIPCCILSCIIYAYKGLLDTSGFAVLAIPAALGGALGSIMLPRIRSGAIQLLFAAAVIWSGFRMMLG